MIIKIDKPRFRSKTLFLDYDWTIVCPKGANKTFAKDVDDWQWLFPHVPDVIKSFYKKGFGICIVTNQSKDWKIAQIKHVLEQLEIPLTICIADKKELYKPSLHIFYEAFSEAQRAKLNKKRSIMCGDALGRKADYSDSDLQFAQAIGIRYISPEQCFGISRKEQDTSITASKDQEVVVLVGPPGSGKTWLCNSVFEKAGYFIAHGDYLKTSTKMVKAAQSHIQLGKSIVFDATNPSKEKRAEYITFAKKHNVKVRCILMKTTLEVAMARNNMRKNPVPRIVYSIYNKKFETPTIDEGFYSVESV